MIVVNGTDKCFGLITRYRKTINGIEESIIDFLIACRRFFNLINRLDIDEKRIHCGNKSVKESDHNLFFLNINTTWDTSVDYKTERIEVYNYKRNEDFESFINETNDNLSLRMCFED